MLKQYPKSSKYKKNHKVNNKFFKLYEAKKVLPEYGSVALQSLKAGKLKYRQIEACRRTIRRSLRVEGFFWIRVSIVIPVTKKPLASRMGKGKGLTSY
jgi:large subunit ribosomal protein L16